MLGFLMAQVSMILAGTLGCLLLVHSAVRFSKVFRLLRYESRSVSGLQSSSGPVKIQGRAINGDDRTVTAPFSGSSCLLYTYEVEERRAGGENRYWETVDEGRESVGLVVDDGTGRIPIDLTGAEVSLDTYSATFKPGAELPERLAEHVARTPGLEPQDGSPLRHVSGIFGGNEQRFTEGRLEPGDDVYVYGQVRRGNATGRGSTLVETTIGDGGEAPLCIISDTNTRGIAWRILRNRLPYVLVGALFVLIAVVGAYFLLSL